MVLLLLTFGCSGGVTSPVNSHIGSQPRIFASGISILIVGSYSPLSHWMIISSSRSSSLASSAVVKPQASRWVRRRLLIAEFLFCKSIADDSFLDMLFVISHASPAHDSISLESVASGVAFAISVMRLPRFSVLRDSQEL